MTPPLRIGTRVSPLAMAQARRVQALLAEAAGTTPDHFPIHGFTTTGDQIQDRPLLEAGGKGLFTKELDVALLAGQIDLAVHSMKDLPTELPDGLALVAVPEREDPRDAFIGQVAPRLADLPEGAVIGTASLRRQAQTLHLRPDLRVVMLRGSVQTRLARVRAGEIDATYLALAGLTRLGLADAVTDLVDPEAMPPAAGQGALAIVARREDGPAGVLLRRLDKAPLMIATTAERAFLAALDGSCRTPIAAHARLSGDRLSLLGEVLTPDGRHRWRRTGEIALGADALAGAAELGRRLGDAIRAEAGPLLPGSEAGAGFTRTGPQSRGT